MKLFDAFFNALSNFFLRDFWKSPVHNESADKKEPNPIISPFDEFMECYYIYRISFLTKEQLDIERENILALDFESDQ